jgi:nucleotide-binding universal stress UspA family protein
MLAIKRILLPTDFSKYSEYAFRLACSLARDYGARLLVLHVAEAPTAIYGEGVVLPPPDAFWKQAGEKLNRIQPRHANIAVEHLLVEGDVAAEILRVAREANSDVIVMGTHGRSGLSRVVMGSVAEQIVRRSPCPVVTVRAQQTTEADVETVEEEPSVGMASA